MRQMKFTLTANHLLKLNPFKFQRVTKYALLYYFVIVIKISRSFFAIAAVRDPSVKDIWVWVAKDPNM